MTLIDSPNRFDKRSLITVEVQQYDNLLVITIAGKIDSESTGLFAQALSEIQPATHGIVINMKEVPYIHSAGLQVLAKFLSENQTEGGNPIQVVLTPRVFRIFEITGFNKFCNILADLEDRQSPTMMLS